MGDPSEPATDVEAEEAAETVDINRPGGVEEDSQDAFNELVEREAAADIPEQPGE